MSGGLGLSAPCLSRPGWPWPALAGAVPAPFPAPPPPLLLPGLWERSSQMWLLANIPWGGSCRPLALGLLEVGSPCSMPGFAEQGTRGPCPLCGMATLAEPHWCPVQVPLEAEEAPGPSLVPEPRALFIACVDTQVAQAARLCSSCGEWCPPRALLLPILGSHPRCGQRQTLGGSTATGTWSVGMWALLCPCSARYHLAPYVHHCFRAILVPALVTRWHDLHFADEKMENWTRRSAQGSSCRCRIPVRLVFLTCCWCQEGGGWARRPRGLSCW